MAKPTDPTKNVLALVKEATKRQDDLRRADQRRIDDLAAERWEMERRADDLSQRNLDTRLLAIERQIEGLRSSASPSRPEHEALVQRVESVASQLSTTGAGRSYGVILISILGSLVVGLAVAFAVHIISTPATPATTPVMVVTPHP